VIRALLALALLQGALPPAVDVRVDRPRVGVGEVVTLTVTVRASDPAPVSVVVNPPDGLALLERREITTPPASAGAPVTATMTLRLRALEPGTWPIGPVRVLQGGAAVDADAVTVEVGDAPALSVLVSNPRLRALLERVPPPRRAGDVSLRLLASAGTVRVGEQIDVVAAAWFPRDLRLKLRRPPVLQPPVIGGVWAREQTGSSGLVTSRLVGGTWYDLFASHQIAFPLAAGTITVPRATLRYGVPVGGPALGQEEPLELVDGPIVITATALPSGAPAGFAGAVGSGLQVERQVDAAGRVGEATTVAVIVSGRGNAALWPAPELSWPTDVRAYPDATSDEVDVRDGRLGGRKIFRYVVVPARAGAVRLPDVRYPYFDPAAGKYRSVQLPAGTLTIRPAAPGSLAKLPLLGGAEAAPARRVVRAVPWWGWLIGLLLPPLLLAIAAWRRPRRRDVPAETRGGAARFRAAVAALVGEGTEDSAVRHGLRALGVTADDIAAVMLLRHRLAEAAYGPGASGIPPSVAQEADRLAARLEAAAARQRRPRRRVQARVGALLTVTVLGAVAQAQTPRTTAEAAYARGDLRTAITGFTTRIERAPDAAAPWYDRGAAMLAGGDDVAATGDFIRAARRAPRSGTIRSALARAGGGDRTARDARWLPPVATDELLLGGIAVWWLGWLLLLVGRRDRRWRRIGGVGVGIALVALGAGAWLRWRERRPLALVREELPLRRSPHERGEAVGTLPRGAGVLLLGERSGWRLVRGVAGEGWVPDDRLVPLAE
jgi:hypothetical protein